MKHTIALQGLFLLYLATTANADDVCTGKSQDLPQAECSVWQDFYYGTGGPNWANCSSSIANDPCGGGCVNTEHL